MSRKNLNLEDKNFNDILSSIANYNPANKIQVKKEESKSSKPQKEQPKPKK